MSTSAPQAAFVARIDRCRGILFKVANAYARIYEDREDLMTPRSGGSKQD